MNGMVVHEELKRGGWRTIVPDMPHIDSTGVKFETRRRSAERNIHKHIAAVMKDGKNLPRDAKKIVRMKRTVKRCYVQFVQITPDYKSNVRGAV